MTIYCHSVSIHSFHGHSSTGMTWNDIPLKWQEWCWNDGFGHSQHIPLIPVIPDCWEKWGHSWFHPCHSGLIPSFGVIRKCSTNVNFPRMTSEWRKILSWSGPVSLRYIKRFGNKIFQSLTTNCETVTMEKLQLPLKVNACELWSVTYDINHLLQDCFNIFWENKQNTLSQIIRQRIRVYWTSKNLKGSSS